MATDFTYDIERHGDTPISVQLKNRIRQGIRRGQLAPGQKLPSIRAMARQLNVSVTPVERAMREMVVEGVLAARRGSGTFVSEPKPTKSESILRMQPNKRLLETENNQMAGGFAQAAPGAKLLYTHHDPDLVSVNIDFLPKIADSLENIDELVCQAYGQTDEHRETYRSLQVDGSYYMLPYAVVHKAVLINKDLFKQAKVELPRWDWTWNDLAQTAEALTDRSKRQYGFVPTGSWDYLLTFVFQNGGSFFSRDGRHCRLAEPEAIEAGEFIRKLSPYGTPQDRNFEEMHRDFFDGRIAMFFCDNWNYYNSHQQQRFEVAARTLPSRRRQITMFRADGYGIKRGSAARGLAVKMLKEIARIELWPQYVAKHPAVPFHPNLTGDDEIAKVYQQCLTLARCSLHEIDPSCRTQRHQHALDLFNTSLRMLRYSDMPVSDVLVHLRDQTTELVQGSGMSETHQYSRQFQLA